MNIFSNFGSQLFRGSVSTNSASYINKQNVNVTLDPSGTDYIDYSNNNNYFEDAHGININDENTTSLIMQKNDIPFYLSTLDDFTLCVKYKLHDDVSSNVFLGQYFNSPVYDLQLSSNNAVLGDTIVVTVTKGSEQDIVYNILGDFTSSDLGNVPMTGTLSDIESVLNYTLYSGGGNFIFTIQGTDLSGTVTISRTYWVAVRTNVLGEKVFAFSETGPSGQFYNQKNISFTAGDSVSFNVSDESNSDFVLDFGSTVDVASTGDMLSYISRTGNPGEPGAMITLAVPETYSGDAIHYFEDSSANMGLDQVYYNMTLPNNDLLYNGTTWTNTLGHSQFDISVNLSASEMPSSNNNVIQNIFTNTIGSDGTKSVVLGSSAYYTVNPVGYSGTTVTVASSQTISGEWIQWEFPYAVRVNSVQLNKDYESASSLYKTLLSNTWPQLVSLVGSNDGTTWTFIEQINTGVTASAYSSAGKASAVSDGYNAVEINNYHYFKQYRMIVESIVNDGGVDISYSSAMSPRVGEIHLGCDIYTVMFNGTLYSSDNILYDLFASTWSNRQSTVENPTGFPVGTYSAQVYSEASYYSGTSEAAFFNYSGTTSYRTGANAAKNGDPDLYLEVSLPVQFIATRIAYKNSTTGDGRNISSIIVYGSNNSTDWNTIHTFTNDWREEENFQVDSIVSSSGYFHFRFQFVWTGTTTYSDHGTIEFGVTQAMPNTVVNYVTVSGSPEVFYINGITKNEVIFQSGTPYYFDQSHPSNAGNTLLYTLVLGDVPDVSANENLLDNQVVVGTPGQPGAYTTFTPTSTDIYYFSYEHPDMGREPPTYYVKVENNTIGEPVFSIKSPNQNEYYKQPILDLSAGTLIQFDVSQLDGYTLVFGTEPDVSNSIAHEYFTQRGNTIVLDIPSEYSGTPLFYFDYSTANMGHKISAIKDLYIHLDFGKETSKDSFTNQVFGTSYSHASYSTSAVSLNGSDLNVTNRNDFRINGLPSPTFTIVYNVMIRSTSTAYWGFSFTQENGRWTSFNHQRYTGYEPSNVYVNNTGVTTTPTYNRAYIDISYNANTRYQLGFVKTSDTMYFYVDNVLVTQFTNKNILNRIDMNSTQANTPASATDIALENIKVYDTVLDMENYVDPSDPIIYYVSVSNEVFLFNDVSFQPNLTFISGEIYSFDQSHESNAGNTLVLGTLPDSSTNLIGYQNIVGTPGQPGAYTSFTASGETVYYYSFETPNMGYEPIPDIWMKLTEPSDISGTYVGNYNGYTNEFVYNTMSTSNTVTIGTYYGISCAYLNQTGYIKFPSGNLLKFCVMCYVYIDNSTTDFCRLIKLSGENGGQGNMDGIVFGSAGIYDKDFSAYPNTKDTWVHLKVNYDRVGGNVTKYVFIDDVLVETYTVTGASFNTDNFVIGQQHTTSLKSKFYMYDFRIYKGIHL